MRGRLGAGGGGGGAAPSVPRGGDRGKGVFGKRAVPFSHTHPCIVRCARVKRVRPALDLHSEHNGENLSVLIPLQMSGQTGMPALAAKAAPYLRLKPRKTLSHLGTRRQLGLPTRPVIVSTGFASPHFLLSPSPGPTGSSFLCDRKLALLHLPHNSYRNVFTPGSRALPPHPHPRLHEMVPRLYPDSHLNRRLTGQACPCNVWRQGKGVRTKGFR